MSEQEAFQGFTPANATLVPDVLFDELLSVLSGAELKVLLYIIRRTLGFKKTTDAISFSQFENGIVTKDGRVLDKGCGLSRETISKALKSLEKRGCIKSEKRASQYGDNDTTLYSIRFKGEVVEKSDHPSQKTKTGSQKNRLPVVGKDDQGGRKNPVVVVGKSDTQVTVQETVIQQTESTHAPSVSSSSSSSTEKEKTQTATLSPEEETLKAWLKEDDVITSNDNDKVKAQLQKLLPLAKTKDETHDHFLFVQKMVSGRENPTVSLGNMVEDVVLSTLRQAKKQEPEQEPVAAPQEEEIGLSKEEFDYISQEIAEYCPALITEHQEIDGRYSIGIDRNGQDWIDILSPHDWQYLPQEVLNEAMEYGVAARMQVAI